MKIKHSRIMLQQALQDNHQKVQEIMCLSDFEYKEQIFERGISFLERLFHPHQQQIRFLSRCPYYWRWWLSEFYRWEFEFLSYYNQHQPEILFETWDSEMTALIGDQITYEGFRNYLKLFHHVRI